MILNQILHHIQSKMNKGRVYTEKVIKQFGGLCVVIEELYIHDSIYEDYGVLGVDYDDDSGR